MALSGGVGDLDWPEEQIKTGFSTHCPVGGCEIGEKNAKKDQNGSWLEPINRFKKNS
jgi:hypothetical protein